MHGRIRVMYVTLAFTKTLPILQILALALTPSLTLIKVVRKREDQRQIMQDQIESARQLHIVLASKISGLLSQVSA